MDGQLYGMLYREREAELVRDVERRRRAKSLRERTARPFTAPRTAERAPRLLAARHRAA